MDINEVQRLRAKVAILREQALLMESERDLAKDEVAKAVDLLREWQTLHARGDYTPLRDHACFLCFPDGPMVCPGWRCRRHGTDDFLAKHQHQPTKQMESNGCHLCWDNGLQYGICPHESTDRRRLRDQIELELKDKDIPSDVLRAVVVVLDAHARTKGANQ